MFSCRLFAVPAVLLAALLAAGCQGSPAVDRIGSAGDRQAKPWSAGPPSVSPSASASADASASATPSATPTPSAEASTDAPAAPGKDATSGSPTTAPPAAPPAKPVKPAPPVRTTEAPAPAPAPRQPAPSGDGGVNFPGVMEGINAQRVAAKLAPLARNTGLEPGARQCSQSNADASIQAGSLTLSHTLAGCGYENLFGATYVMSAGDIVQGWMDSPGHRRAMMDPKIKTIGVGWVNVGGYFMIAAAFGF